MSKPNYKSRVPAELCSLLRSLESEKRAQVEALFASALETARDRRIIDLWGRPEVASSYWILIASAIDDSEESKIAEVLLKWRAFLAKEAALLECLQASEREWFRCCAKRFQIVGYPSLVVGSAAEMSEFVTFGPRLLHILRAQKGTFYRFLTAVHSSIERTGALSELRTKLAEDRFWSDFHISAVEARRHILAFPVVSPEFDVFLSHNSKDKVVIRELAEALKARGLRVWLDEWELIPGRPWHDALEQLIEKVKTAIVAVGKDGLGPWEIPEMRGCISQFIERNMPVIPVILPGVDVVPELPLFLRQFTWVDLRSGLSGAALDRLEWGITGRGPAR